MRNEAVRQLERGVLAAAPELAQRRTGVLYGGTSAEDRLYLQHKSGAELSVHQVIGGLAELGIPAEWCDPTSATFLDQLSALDIAMLNMHGEFGEDGSIQGLLTMLGIPYTGSGIAASAVGSDKRIAKHLAVAVGVRTPRAVALGLGDADPEGLDAPLMLKCVRGGSSVGIELVRDRAQLPVARQRLAVEGFSELLAEEFIDGTPGTVSVVFDGRTPVLLPPIVCRTGRDYYDEFAKLHGEATAMSYEVVTDPRHPIWAPMTEATERLLDVLDLSGAVRFDYVVRDGTAWFLEINTCPGIQHGSNLVLAAEAAGLEYAMLLGAILASATGRTRLAPWHAGRRLCTDPGALAARGVG